MTTAKAAQQLHADSSTVIRYTNHGLVMKPGRPGRLRLQATWRRLPNGRRVRDFSPEAVATFKRRRRELGI